MTVARAPLEQRQHLPTTYRRPKNQKTLSAVTRPDGLGGRYVSAGNGGRRFGHQIFNANPLPLPLYHSIEPMKRHCNETGLHKHRPFDEPTFEQTPTTQLCILTMCNKVV